MYVTFYRDEFDSDIWLEYCNILEIDPHCEYFTIKNIKQKDIIESEITSSYEDEDDE